MALKLLRRRDAADDALGSSVIEEGRLQARVRHPGVITIHGADRIDGRVGLWMEFIQGRTLEQELDAHGPFDATEAAQIGLELCRALGAVHEEGLLHRDVKAQNVMRDEKGRLVLGDFGTGRGLVDRDGREGDTADDVAGTPLYLAPEIFRREPATVHSDLYSLGVLLYHLVTGSFPVRGRSARQLRDTHDLGSSLPLAEARPTLPEPFVQVVDRALDPEAGHRYASAAEMEAALAACVSPPQDRSRFWRVAAGVAAMLVIAIGAIAAATWSGLLPATPRTATTTGSTEEVTAGPGLSLVLNEAIVSSQNVESTSHDFSPSGDRIVFTARWDLLEPDPARRGPGARNGTQNIALYLADRAGTLIRPVLTDWGPLADLVTPPGTPGAVPWVRWVNHQRWSPDGRWIAFLASRPSEAYPNRLAEVPRDQFFQESRKAYERALFVVSAEGGSPHQVGPGLPEVTSESRPFDLWWTPDSEHLAYLTREGVQTLTLDGRATGVVEMQANEFIQVAGYSPDGRWIAFESGNRIDGESSLFVAPATGGRVIRQGHILQPEGPGLDTKLASALRPAWSLDGRALYAVSDASGTLNIWKFPIDPETGVPAGEPEQVTSYTDGAALAPRILTGIGGLAFTLVQQRDTIQVADAERYDTPRTVARGRNPKLSPDGETIYYLGQGPGQEGIWAVPRAGGTPQRLTTARLLEQPFNDGFDLSPDGTMVAFRNEDEAGHRLYVLSTAGGEPRAIHEFASDQRGWGPFFSPDGSVVAFTEGSGLYVMPPAGGEPTKLAHLREWGGYSARWSPDGRYLAVFGWESPDSDGNGIFLVPASGGEMRRLTPITGEPNSWLEGLEWHPDSQRIVYFDYGPERVRFVDLSGNVSPPLFDQVEGWEYLGRWAPDGNQFFFISSIDTQWKTYRYDIRDGEIHRAFPGTDETSSDGVPVWSGDGTTMAWSSGIELRQIWLMENVD